MKSVHSRRYAELLARLKRARGEAGLTQIEVAEALGRLQSFVSKCESGERRIDVIELEDYAALYRKPLAYFVEPASPARFGPRRKETARRPDLTATPVARERPVRKYARTKGPKKPR